MRTLALAALLAVAAPCLAGTPLPDGPHVATRGQGKATAKPDLARITLSARVRNPRPGPAKASVDAAVDAFLQRAPGFALRAADITASDLSVGENIDFDGRDRRVSDGFEASRSVTVALRDLERLGELLDAALASGMTQIDSVAFESSREAELRREARGRAIADAREKADGLAVAFGAAVGPVYSINSVGANLADGYGVELDRVVVTGSRARSSVYLQPTVEYTEHVSAVFELKR